MLTPLQRRVAAQGATLFAVGMVTGLWSAVALAGKVTVGIPHMALAAHLNGLFGGFWLLLVAWTLPFLHYGDRAKGRLVFGVAVTAWGNWGVTVVGSFLGVTGLDYNASAANNVIAALLQGFVVLPGLVASIAWAWGFWRREG